MLGRDGFSQPSLAYVPIYTTDDPQKPLNMSFQNKRMLILLINLFQTKAMLVLFSSTLMPHSNSCLKNI